MKRFLLFATLLLAIIPWMAAQTATLSFAGVTATNPAYINNAAGVKVATMTISGGQTGSNGYIQFLNNRKLTITGEEGIVLTQAVFTVQTGSSYVTSFNKSGSTTFTPDNGTLKDLTWTGESNSFTITRNNQGKQMRITGVTITYTVPSTNPTPEISWSAESCTQYFGATEAGAYPTLTVPEGFTVSYASSKPEVATINENTGVITIVAVGTTEITATTAAAEVGGVQYDHASATYTLKVVDASKTVTYELLTNIANLTNGTEGVIVAPNQNKIMSSKLEGNKATPLDVEIENNSISEVPEGTAIVTFELSGSDYSLKIGEVYLNSGSSNDLASGTDKGTASIKLTDGNYADIVFTKTTAKAIQYNATNGMFRNYNTGTQKPIQIFVKKETSLKVSAPTIEAAGGILSDDQKYIILEEENQPAYLQFNAPTIDDEEAQIYYMVGDEGTFKLYTTSGETPEIAEGQTITYYAEYHGVKSAMCALATTTITKPEVQFVIEGHDEYALVTLQIKDFAKLEAEFYYNFTLDEGPTAAPAREAAEGFQAYNEPFRIDGPGTINAYAVYNGVTGEVATKDVVASELTGVEGIVVDANAPVRYFDLQGRPVANPRGGIFIRVAGGKATKVAIR